MVLGRRFHVIIPRSFNPLFQFRGHGTVLLGLFQFLFHLFERILGAVPLALEIKKDLFRKVDVVLVVFEIAPRIIQFPLRCIKRVLGRHQLAVHILLEVAVEIVPFPLRRFQLKLAKLCLFIDAGLLLCNIQFEVGGIELGKDIPLADPVPHLDVDGIDSA